MLHTAVTAQCTGAHDIAAYQPGQRMPPSHVKTYEADIRICMEYAMNMQ